MRFEPKLASPNVTVNGSDAYVPSPAVPSARVADLVARMTIAEKIGQLNMISIGGPPTGPIADEPSLDLVRDGGAGSVLNLVGRARIDEARRIARDETRLGIPLLTGLDVVHGYRTVFPAPLGETAAFDETLWRTTAAAAAAEARADGIDLTFAPMLDIGRDPRWGRIVEGPGEDPWLGARFATAKVAGFQGGTGPGPIGVGAVATTAKHFCAYGAVEAGRDYAPVDVSDRTLEEVYLPPFRAAVEAGAAAIMPAFVDIAGVPLSAHPGLLDGCLRRRWGFDGVLISDWNAIGELLRHAIAADEAEAAALALRAGLDVDMMSGVYPRGLPEALARGLVDAALIDASVVRVLMLKERLGLFDDRSASVPAPATGLAPVAHRELARDAAARSAVLLENRGGLLPLGAEPRSIALIGPFALAGDDALGPWAGCGEGAEAVTLGTALPAALPNCRVEVAAGVDVKAPGRDGIPAAVEAARRADLVVLCLGEASSLSGEAASRANPTLTGDQEALAHAVIAVGRPIVLVLTCGRPLIVPWLFEAADAVLIGWFPGTEGGSALAEILTGRREPLGRLPVTWPRHVGQIPIHFGTRPGGRPFNPADSFTSRYVDMPNAPLYPFGAGRGYATFRLDGLEVSPRTIDAEAPFSVVGTVENDSDRDGTTVVFLFVRDLVAMPNRPILELRGFARVAVAARSSAPVRFDLGADTLASLDETRRPRVEPGRFEIRLGFDADPSGHVVADLTVAGAGV